MSSSLDKAPGRAVGCYGRQPGGSAWVCTDHFQRDGEILHVAANSMRVVGVWLDNDRNIVWNGAALPSHREQNNLGPSTLKELYRLLDADPRFGIVTDEEMTAAAHALEQLIEEMSSENQ